jgi:tRNA (guanine37-N1)-methyltransferase
MTYPITVLTLFPEMFPGVCGLSVVGRALKAGLWSLTALNMRDFTTDKHRTVDDTPYGGGAGMLLRADVVAAGVRAAKAVQPDARTLYLAPHGKRLEQADVRRLAGHSAGLIVLCGHYEGVDERVLEAEVDEVISLGDYVLSGGEPAAMVLMDAVVRLLPGVLGAGASLHEESFDIIDPDTGALLPEYPHYTRPAVWEGREVPAVLQNGNHGAIKAWRLDAARRRRG